MWGQVQVIPKRYNLIRNLLENAKTQSFYYTHLNVGLWYHDSYYGETTPMASEVHFFSDGKTINHFLPLGLAIW